MNLDTKLMNNNEPSMVSTVKPPTTPGGGIKADKSANRRFLLEKETETKENDKLLTQTDSVQHNKYDRLRIKIENRLQFFKEQVDFRLNHAHHDKRIRELERFEKDAKHYLNRLYSVSSYFNKQQDVYRKKTRSWRDRLNQAEKIQGEIDAIYEDAYKWAGNWPKRADHIKKVLGITLPEKYLRESDINYFYTLLEEAGWQTCVECLKKRMILEINECLKNKWVMVFTTLTVRGDRYEDVFKKGSNAFRYYIRRFRDRLGAQLYGSVRESRGMEFFEYIAVVESGEKRGQLHIHIVKFMKKPLKCRDPNYGKNIPINREISEYARLWDWGYSQSIAVRWSRSDVWAKMGFRWPVDAENNNQPIMPSSIKKISQYLVKYILKSNRVIIKGDTKTWRTRNSKTFGKKKLQWAMSRLTNKELVALVKCKNQPVPIIIHNETMPTKIIRPIAIRELIIRFRLKTLRYKSSQKNTHLKTLGMLGTQKKQDHNRQNIGLMMHRILNGTDTSDTYNKYYQSALETLQREMR